MTGEDRKTVRVSREVFEELDARFLGTERGPSGRPSVNDFLALDLVGIIDTFATRFDELPMLIDGRTDYRILVTKGNAGVRLRRRRTILSADGTVEILSIDLDRGVDT